VKNSEETPMGVTSVNLWFTVDFINVESIRKTKNQNCAHFWKKEPLLSLLKIEI
jgi:hypothetical protein